MAKTEEEYAAQLAAEKKKADDDFKKANEEALASRREILKSLGLPDDTQPGAQAKKKDVAVEPVGQPATEPPKEAA